MSSGIRFSAEAKSDANRQLVLGCATLFVAAMHIPGVVEGALTYACYLPVSLAIWHFAEVKSDEPLPAPRPLETVFSGGVEEILFRGAVALFPNVYVAATSITLFAAMHYPKFGTLKRCIPVAISAIIYTGLCFSYGLPAAVAAHMLHNLVHQCALTYLLANGRKVISES